MISYIDIEIWSYNSSYLTNGRLIIKIYVFLNVYFIIKIRIPNFSPDIRFDGMKLMEMLRDKRLMFIGDSVQRGMFESMICLVQSALPKVVRRSLQRIPPRKVFRVEVPNPHARTHNQ